MKTSLTSLSRELGLWLLILIISFLLALPLALFEHQYDLVDLISPQLSYQEYSYVSPGTFKATSFEHSKFEPSTQVSLLALSPEMELLDTLSDNLYQPNFNKALGRYDSMIEKTAAKHQVSPVLVKAVIQAESNYNPDAVSQNGAVGLMQILPSTARAMGVNDARDPQKNITAGVKYLKMLLTMFNDDERLALAAYNCGPETIKRFGNKMPPIKETHRFVDKVMNYYNSNLES